METTTNFDLTLLPVCDIAQMIINKGIKIPAYVRPYLEAMLSMQTINDAFGLDSGRSIVLYFLANAQYMRGDFMHAVKDELRTRLNKEAKDYGSR